MDPLMLSKQKWLDSVTLAAERKRLLVHREELHEKIAERSYTVDDEEFNLLRKEKQKIDHRLDELEEVDEELLRNIYLNEIFANNPTQKQTYSQLEEKVISLEKEILIIQSIKNTLETLKIIFEETAAIRNRVRKWGVLSYIFGLNPNVHISKLLQSAAFIAGDELHLLNDAKWPYARPDPQRFNDAKWPYARPDPQRFNDAKWPYARPDPQKFDPKKFFYEVKEKCSKKWGFKTIDNEIKPLSNEIEIEYAECTREEKMLENNKKAAEEQLTKFLVGS